MDIMPSSAQARPRRARRSRSTLSCLHNQTRAASTRVGFSSTHSRQFQFSGTRQCSRTSGAANTPFEHSRTGDIKARTWLVANILSLAGVRKVCWVIMDTCDEPALHVHRLNGSIMKFVEHASGLCVYNSNATNDNITGYFMLSTVAQQKNYACIGK